jgi:hypothetical protein
LGKAFHPERSFSPHLSGWTKHGKALTIETCIRVMDAPTNASNRDRAVRIYCDWMIDAFLKDRGANHDGKSLGVL